MACRHLLAVHPVPPHSPGCEECLKLGTHWVHLRLCLNCGHIGCCDSSPGRHASRHARETTHPVVASYEPGELWAWCFIDQMEVEVPDSAIPFLKER